MPLSFDVNVNAFAAQVKKRVVGMFPAARDALEREGKAFHKAFKSARLSGRKGTVGLHARTGDLRRAFIYRVTGDRLDRMRLVIGWPTRGKEAMKASVHETGKIIKGRPWLVFRLLGPRGGDYGWKKVRQVRIPARLEFFKHWKKGRVDVIRGVKAELKRVVEGG